MDLEEGASVVGLAVVDLEEEAAANLNGGESANGHV